jgi:hypothetical protein
MIKYRMYVDLYEFHELEPEIQDKLKKDWGDEFEYQRDNFWYYQCGNVCMSK